jgi:predicted GIY-YIG superfamily endonuclease
MHACIYLIKCKGTCPNLPNFYIGSYRGDVEKRFLEHKNRIGAKFTQRFEPISYEILEIVTTNRAELYKREHTITLNFVKKYGFRRVRGGNWVNMRPDCYLLRNLIWLLSPLKSEIKLGLLGCPDPSPPDFVF